MQRRLGVNFAFAISLLMQKLEVGPDGCTFEVRYNGDTLRTTHALDSVVMLRHPEFSSVEPAFAYLSTIEDCHIRYSGGDCPPGAIVLEMGSDSIGDYVAMRYSTTDSVNQLALEYACLQRSIGHSIIGSFDIGQSYSEVCARLDIDADQCPHDIYLRYPSGFEARIMFTDDRVRQILINTLSETSKKELYFREDGKYRHFFYF